MPANALVGLCETALALGGDYGSDQGEGEQQEGAQHASRQSSRRVVKAATAWQVTRSLRRPPHAQL